ncbi:MAG: EAL domain-containing protein [Chromatiales bacterium]|jgi:diguanylate cyclase (GGDEF)-like protein/PAS domain S-box-containing protein
MAALLSPEQPYFGKIFDSIADTVLLIDAASGRFIDFNLAAIDHLGYSRQQLLNMSVLDIDAGISDLNEFKKATRVLLDGTEQSLLLNTEFVRKDHSSFPVEIKLSRTGDEQQTWLVALARDLGERHTTPMMVNTLDYTDEAVIVVNRSGDISGYNQRFVQLWNIPDKLIGKRNDAGLIACVVEQLLEPANFLQGVKSLHADAQARVEDVLLCRDGRVLEYYSHPQDSDGEYSGRVWSFRDVTERSRSAKALQDSEATYRSVVATSKDGFWITDRNGRILEVNDSYLDMTGYTREQMLEFNIADLEFDTASRELANHVEIIREFGGSIFSTRHRDAAGLPVDVELGVSYWEGMEGRMFVFIRDITERVYSEQLMQLTQQAFDATSEGIIVTDPDGVIVLVNPAFERISGYSEQELVGEKADILMSGKHDDAFYSQMWRSLVEHGMWSGEIWNRRKDGELYSELLTINAIHSRQDVVTHYVATFSDISELKQVREQSDFLAYHDPLTCLPNRLLLHDRIDHALSRAQRDQKQLAVFYLDLDRFKNVNDSLGHALGDKLLKTVSTQLANRLRSSDTLARVGGDEFVILLEDQVSLREVTGVANKIMDVFARQITLQQNQLYITASIGISFFPHDGHDTASLLKNAELAMFQAKNKGRNNFEFYDHSMTQGSLEKMVLENALQGAIQREELFVVYQPQVRLDTGAIEGVEALVRWQHPDMGVIFPDQFIGLAEEIGIVHRVGEFVLRTACKQMVEWQEQGFDISRISVNLSALQLERASLANEVADILEQTGLSADCLEVEVTEPMIMCDSGRSIATLGQLRQLGISIAVDDFGTGYLSLGYLKNLPVDRLKIDKSFVRDMVSDSSSLNIIKAMVAMSESLGYDIMAEGIETSEQIALLLEHGCRLGQGYNYLRPEKSERILELLNSDQQQPFQPVS